LNFRDDAGNKLAVDGIWGPKSKEAAKKYIKATGISLSTDNAVNIFSGTKLAVMNVQAALVYSKFLSGPDAVNGDANPDTIAALKKFQAKHNLSPDGICEPLTRKAIMSYSPEPKSI